MEKIYLTADQLLCDSFTLAARVLQSGYRPTIVVGLWRGGSPIAIAVQEYLEYCGYECDHIAVRTRSYDGIDQRKQSVQVDGLEYLVKNLHADDRVLLVDDVHDSGNSMAEVIRKIEQICSSATIKTACCYLKPARNKVDFIPDYYLIKTDDWLVFPHELIGLSEHELAENKPEVARLMGIVQNPDQPA